MLNELYVIYRGLEAIGEDPEIKHNDIQQPGFNNITFRVMLDKYGLVTTVRLMEKEDIKNTWSLGNKHTQFPAVKVKRPLIPSAHNDYQKWLGNNKNAKEADYRDVIECLTHLYFDRVSHFDFWPRYRDKIIKKKQFLKKYEGCKEVYELFRRYSLSKTGVEILEQVAKKLIISAFEDADLKVLKAICALFFGEKLKPSGEVVDNKRITLLLDCFPRDDIDIYATSRKYIHSLSQALFAEEEKTIKKKACGTCALTGKAGQMLAEKFPEEKLAVIGPTILFAKNEETSGKTVERYGQARGNAFPVSAGLSLKLAAAISFLTADKRENVTWAKLPSSSLLLAYCRNNFDLPLTPLITGESEIEDIDDYYDATESVLESFKGKDLSLDASVDFVEIIKVDKGNRKVNFSTTARIGQLMQAVQQWRKACSNTPDFKLFAQMGKMKQKYRPWVISPKQVMALSHKKYIRNGMESLSVPGISFADALRLFLGRNREIWVREWLWRIANQYQALFQRCALSKVQEILPKKKITVKTNPKHNAEVLSAVTLMAVLLYYLGRTKEKYMNNFAFIFGQLCSALDEVHIGYCVSERKGNIPTTLLGNQIYGMALHDPVKAMAFLAQRIRPYNSWVKRIKFQNKSKDNKVIKNAIFAQRWIGEHIETLKQHLLSGASFVNSDNYKAELMLGYLAGRPFRNKEDIAKSDITKEAKHESAV